MLLFSFLAFNILILFLRSKYIIYFYFNFSSNTSEPVCQDRINDDIFKFIRVNKVFKYTNAVFFVSKKSTLSSVFF